MVETLDIYNIPRDVLYQYSTKGYYVWKVQRYSTLNGNYESATATLFTEIYRVNGDGTVSCQWSGGLIDNPSVYGKGSANGENVFGIFSWDMDTSSNFQIDMPLTVAPAEIASKVKMPTSKKSL